MPNVATIYFIFEQDWSSVINRRNYLAILQSINNPQGIFAQAFYPFANLVEFDGPIGSLTSKIERITLLRENFTPRADFLPDP